MSNTTDVAARILIERTHGRVLEQQARRQAQAECVLKLLQHRHGEQRVAAEIEEVVMDADALEPEGLGK